MEKTNNFLNNQNYVIDDKLKRKIIFQSGLVVFLHKVSYIFESIFYTLLVLIVFIFMFHSVEIFILGFFIIVFIGSIGNFVYDNKYTPKSYENYFNLSYNSKIKFQIFLFIVFRILILLHIIYTTYINYKIFPKYLIFLLPLIIIKQNSKKNTYIRFINTFILFIPTFLTYILFIYKYILKKNPNVICLLPIKFSKSDIYEYVSLNIIKSDKYEINFEKIISKTIFMK